MESKGYSCEGLKSSNLGFGFDDLINQKQAF